MRRGVMEGLPIAAVAVVGVVCCAGLPALATVLGGLALGAVLGVAGGVLVLAGLIAAAVLLVRMRRRRRCSPPATGGLS
jgi:hypothetical protein